jgi:hypothetical protein
MHLGIVDGELDKAINNRWRGTVAERVRCCACDTLCHCFLCRSLYRALRAFSVVPECVSIPACSFLGYMIENEARDTRPQA